MAKIRYSNTVEDLVLFALVTHEPRTTWGYSFWRAFFPFVVFSVALVLAEVSWVVFALVFTVIYLWLLPKTTRYAIEMSVRKLLSEGRNEGILCEHELELTPSELIERTAVSELHSALSSLEGWLSTATHTFVYTSSHAGHMIPRHAVSEGDYDAFTSLVRERVSPRMGKDPA